TRWTANVELKTTSDSRRGGIDHWRGEGECYFPESLVAAVFQHGNPVADDFGINWVGKASHQPGGCHLIVCISQFRQVQIQHVLAGVLKRAGHTVCVGIARRPTQDETMSLKR